MVIQITLQELMFFLVGALVIVAGILLLPILWNIKKVVTILRSVVETHQESISKNIGIMPQIFANTEKITSNVRESTEKLKNSIPVILHDVERVTSTAKDSMDLASDVMTSMGLGANDSLAVYKKETPNLLNYIHFVEEIIKIIYRTFSSNQQ